MKLLSALFIGLTAFSFSADAQKYVIAESNVHFFSSAPLENIEADTKDTKAVLDSESNAFSFRVPINSFTFDKALMQEHFNENYMESEKYPNGTFKGNIEGEYDLTEDGEYDVEAVGTLDIHGVSQERRIASVITVEDGVPKITTKFMVQLEEHKVKIPKVVFYNIAEEIEVTLEATLKAFKNK